MAKAKKSVTDLSFFSYDYQCSILKLFMENEEFALSTVDTMDQNHFSGSSELRKIAAVIKEKVSKLNRSISYEELELYLKTTVDDAITLEKCMAIIDEKMKPTTYTEGELNTIKEEYHNFLVAMETVKLGNEITQLNKDGAKKEDVMAVVKKYDDRTTFDEVIAEDLKIGREEFLRLISQEKYETIPTGCKYLDERLGGGMRKGDFGILVAGTGIGKTCVTSGFAAYAAWKGYKVAHIILEDKKDDIKDKYLAYILNVGVNYFKNTIEGRELVTERYDMIGEEKIYNTLYENLKPIYAIDRNEKMHRLSVRDIDNMLTKLENGGFKADLVIIDYFDRIKCSISNIEIWRKDQIISDELNELAINHNVAMWVPSQGNKTIQDRTTRINISNISGGAWKGFTAQIVVSMQKNLEDLSTNITTVNFLKNRYNNDFTPISIEFDNGTCRFGKLANDDSAIYGNDSEQVADTVFDDNRKRKK